MDLKIGFELWPQDFLRDNKSHQLFAVVKGAKSTLVQVKVITHNHFEISLGDGHYHNVVKSGLKLDRWNLIQCYISGSEGDFRLKVNGKVICKVPHSLLENKVQIKDILKSRFTFGDDKNNFNALLKNFKLDRESYDNDTEEVKDDQQDSDSIATVQVCTNNADEFFFI